MSKPIRINQRIAAAVAAGCVGLTLASTAGAVDLRDWGRKFAVSERYVVLSQFNKEAVLDKETQLLWQAVPGSRTSGRVTWKDASLYCYKATTGGRRGWRLPTFPELASLMGFDGVQPPVFKDVPVETYWTTSPFPGSASFAMVIQLPGVPTAVAGGNNTPTSTQKFGFWCVRGAE